ncbi:MAG: excinuclease ABC subunit UvrC [Desulfobacterales bacterium]
MKTQRLKEKLKTLPDEPGVYLMKDKPGNIIYIGKAKNLRNRLKAYFAGTKDERALMPFLTEEIADVETVVGGNEKEALILENELIKRHKPRFNIKLKEGGTFVYLRLDLDRTYPRLEVTRRVKKDGARYFGPYPAARALRETLRVMNRYFKLRTCSDHDPGRHKRPCLLCQISTFPESSVYDIPSKDYRRHVKDAVSFLQGKKPELLNSLRHRMEKASGDLNFEEAARLRDQIEAIKRTLEPQAVIFKTDLDADVLGFFQMNNFCTVYLVFVRHGRAIGGRALSFEAAEKFSGKDRLASFLTLYYSREHFVPDEIWLPFGIEGQSALEEVLSERKDAKVSIVVPKTKDKRALLMTSQRNARLSLYQSQKGDRQTFATLMNLQNQLGLEHMPRYMECFDVSHFKGDAIVAAKAAMKDGKPDKNRYRRYKIKSVTLGDDYAAMHEAVFRRLRHGMEENDLPDLIVLDGGKGQLTAARRAMSQLKISGIDMIALAKDRNKKRKDTAEFIYLPGKKKAVVLKQSSAEQLILMQLRDEAHRFAITYQKRLLRETVIASRLDRIPGIGKKRRKSLLRRFGSIKRIAAASTDDLAQTKGIGQQTARDILFSLKTENQPTKPRESFTSVSRANNQST